MKRFILLSLFFLLTIGVYAQRNADSIAYQLQRKKINAMLAQRTQKFGRYDASLSQHTGIFGFQTKRDIRNSNDILMDIVKTDDSIYREIKVLLDFRAYQQTQTQTHVQQVEQNTLGYMTTINKLRGKIDQLKSEAKNQQLENEKMDRVFIVSLIIMGAIILILFRTKRKSTPATKTKRKPTRRTA